MGAADLGFAQTRCGQMIAPDGPVIAAVLEYGEFPEVLRSAEIVRHRCHRETLIFFVKPNYRRLAEDTAVAVERGFDWIDAAGNRHGSAASSNEEWSAAAPRTGANGHPPLGNRRRQSRLRTLAIDLVNGFADYRRIRARAKKIGQILERYRPALVIVGQAPLGSELSFMLNAAKRLGTPSLFVPYAMFNLEEYLEFSFGREAHHVSNRPLNWGFARMYPRWSKWHRGKELLRLPAARGLALQLAGFAGHEPWSPCVGPLTAMACDSVTCSNSLRDMGLTTSVTAVVGAAVHDRLAAHRAAGARGRAEICARFNIDPDKPLLVCGWPANLFAWKGAVESIYQDYASLARFWAQALAAVRDEFGVQIFVSVHPKTLDEEISEATRFGLVAVRGETEALIAHCDMFVTLNGSSITAWAIACEKPVLLYDCFETGYPEFVSTGGCITARSEFAFQAELRRLCSDAQARSEVAGLQARVAADWGVLDGKAADRLAGLVDDLIAGTTSERRGRTPQGRHAATAQAARL